MIIHWTWKSHWLLPMSDVLISSVCENGTHLSVSTCELQTCEPPTCLERKTAGDWCLPELRRTSSKAGGGVDDVDGRLCESPSSAALARKVTKVFHKYKKIDKSEKKWSINTLLSSSKGIYTTNNNKHKRIQKNMPNIKKMLKNC